MLSGFWLGDALRPADRRHRLQDGVLRHAALLEQRATDGDCAPSHAIATKQVLGADVLVLQPFGFRLGRVGDLPQPRRERRLRAAVRAAAASCSSARTAPPTPAGSAFIFRSDLRDDAFALLDQRQQQVLRRRFRVALAVGELLRGKDRFLCFLRVLVDVHFSSRSAAVRASALG